jgi:hypothetical protein
VRLGFFSQGCLRENLAYLRQLGFPEDALADAAVGLQFPRAKRAAPLRARSLFFGRRLLLQRSSRDEEEQHEDEDALLRSDGADVSRRVRAMSNIAWCVGRTRPNASPRSGLGGRGMLSSTCLAVSTIHSCRPSMSPPHTFSFLSVG